MAEYINKEQFLKWYAEKSGNPTANEEKLLKEVFENYCTTGREYYELPTEKSANGTAERFPFHFEDVGCCGASTYVITFGDDAPPEGTVRL